MPVRLFCPWNFSKQGTCMPAPSPHLTGFPVTITLHSLHSLSLQIYYYTAVVNVPLQHYFSWQLPHICLMVWQIPFLHKSPQSSSWRKGVQIFCYSWYPMIYEGVSKLTSKPIRIVSSSLISVNKPFDGMVLACNKICFWMFFIC